MKSKNYDEFVDKFKPKLTTDDCYTPPEVYEWIKNYVVEQCNISPNTRILRPFKPGGDYQAEDYSGDCVVIDNPPFSILSQICRWYFERGIRFYLFAQHLTLFCCAKELPLTRIIASADITYTNGAKIKTAFISNMYKEPAVLVDPKIRAEIRQIQKDLQGAALPKYEYPKDILTVSRLSKIVERGVQCKIDIKNILHISKLDSQKPHKKGLFGGGYLLSKKAAAEIKAAEIKAAEIKATEIKAAENITYWKLSEREINLINRMR